MILTGCSGVYWNYIELYRLSTVHTHDFTEFELKKNEVNKKFSYCFIKAMLADSLSKKSLMKLLGFKFFKHIQVVYLRL